MKKPEDLITYRGKEVSQMSRDELEAAFREMAAYYENRLQQSRESLHFMCDVAKRRAA